MTRIRHHVSAPTSAGDTAFGRFVASSTVTASRRDVFRTGAVLAGAAALSGAIVASPVFGLPRASAQDTSTMLTLPFNPFGQPVLLDPHRAPNWGPFWVLFPHIWAGPLAFDELGAIVPDLADSVEPNDTADVWTCSLRPGLTFASGRPVDAESCIASWKRALDPEGPAPMSVFMSEVQGYADYIAGNSTEIGFAAVDEVTVEITLGAPNSSFPASLATFGWAVLDLDVAEGGTPDPGAPTVPGAGMWQVDEFVDGDHLRMVPNPASYLAPSPSISAVTWQFVEGPDADDIALDGYRDNTLAIADVPASAASDVGADQVLSAELVTVESQASTMAIGMDFAQPPLDNVAVRQAVAAAVDRDAWASDIWQEEFVPAIGCVPPVVGLTSGYAAPTLIAFDAEAARQAMEEAGITAQDGSLEIVYYQPAEDDPNHIARHASLLDTIEANSGLVIRHDTSLSRDQIEGLRTDNNGSQFDIVWWWTVSPTPSLLDSIGTSTSPEMAGRFNWSGDLEDGSAAESSMAFDSLIDDAKATTDEGERNAAYGNAEQLLIDQAVYIPLGHWVQRFVQKPWLRGTRQGPWSGSIPVRFDEAVTIEESPEA